MSADQTANIGWHVWVGTSTTLIPATALVGARFFARRRSKVGLKADDWTILAALVADWMMTSIRYYELCNTGLGHHSDDLPPRTVVRFWKSFLAVQNLYFTTAVLTKTSILLLYRRIFWISDRFQRAVYFAMALVASYFILCVVMSIAGCQPVSYLWNKNQPGHCIREVQFFRWNGVSNLLLDAFILVLPLPMVWKLKMQPRQKMGLIGIFCLGGFVCLASGLRIAQFEKTHQRDPTFGIADSSAWSSIEQNVGIMCACLPTLRPLFRPKPDSRYQSRQLQSSHPSSKSEAVFREDREDSGCGLQPLPNAHTRYIFDHDELERSVGFPSPVLSYSRSYDF